MRQFWSKMWYFFGQLCDGFVVYQSFGNKLSFWTDSSNTTTLCNACIIKKIDFVKNKALTKYVRPGG